MSTKNSSNTWAKRSIQEVDKILTGPGLPWEIETKVIKGRETKVYKALPPSLRDFWLSTKQFGERDYIVYQEERVTYAQAHVQVATIAELFRQRGVVKGDRVAIVMRNYPEWITCFWAIHALGGIAVAVNAWSPLEPLTHCLTNSGCKIAIVDDERAKVLISSLKEVKAAGCSAVFVVRPSSVPAGFESLAEALKGCENKALPQVDISADDNAVIFFTSGTTALPKGVLSTQRMYLSNLLNTKYATVRAALRRGEDMPVPDPAALKAVLLSIPLFHVTGNQSFLSFMTAGGGKLVIMHKWSLAEAVELIRREKITTAGGVPHMVQELIDSALGEDQSHTLEGFSFGGAPSSSKLPATLAKRMPQVALATAYGLTETNAVVVSHSGEDYLERPTSCGIPPPVCEIKIVCPLKLVDLPPHTTGEIYLKGPNVADSYWNNPKATQEAFSHDGWFQSGDIGHLDHEGFLYISDRAKEIIIRGGENISTIQVEDALYQDDRVKDAAVVPVPDHRLGELVAAVVVTKPEYHGKVTEAELIALVAKSLPKHCVPVMVVVREEPMPRNANGKTLKRELKAELALIWEERMKNEKVPAKL